MQPPPLRFTLPANVDVPASRQIPSVLRGKTATYLMLSWLAVSGLRAFQSYPATSPLLPLKVLPDLWMARCEVPYDRIADGVG